MNSVLSRIVLISCVVFFACEQKPPPPVLPTPVNVYTVTQEPVLYYDKYPSTTQALSQVNLMPEVQGYITGIFVNDGSQVRKGQPLYEIDRRLYQSAYDAAAANVKVAQGNLEQAQQDADRYVYLNSYHAVAKQQYDHAVITLENAKNQVKAAEEALKTAKTNLTYAIISAPFDGTVGFSQVKLGNMVTIGQTVLNTISTNDPMAVDFLVNEKQLAEFEKFQRNKQADKDSLFTMLLPNGTMYTYPGKISVIDRAVDPQTGSIRVRLVFPNPKHDLKVGMSCVVRVRNQETTPQMLVPSKAIVEQMGEYFVFVAKDTLIAQPADSTNKKSAGPATPEGPKLRAIQKKVKLSQTIGENVIVVSGINKGDKVIVDGVQAVHDGSAIMTGNKKPAADSSKKAEGNKK
jgi:membrane fusion protein (multidrug efflux system)